MRHQPAALFWRSYQRLGDKANLALSENVPRHFRLPRDTNWCRFTQATSILMTAPAKVVGGRTFAVPASALG